MTTVFLNADFISLNEENDIYSVMVTHGKKIEYIGFSTPLCYDSEKIIDLGGAAVLPLICDKVLDEYKHSQCSVLSAGEQADFVVFDKNPYKFDDAKIIDIFVKSKKQKI
ncbi:MAG: hypothetical protein NC213_00785 [Acetobacter sp.]|nr:hypothetical protein [Bacteroides sp.]MCM1340262.1 hypothetical protein [Acetobacter sp.]MCM1432788.1 hypothetical protein [Clostridiales bacterium]